MYYFTILILSIFSFLKQSNLKKSLIKVFGVISFIYFIIFGGFRYNVGADWGPYKILYDRTTSWFDVFNFREEKLYMILEYVVKILFVDYSVFIFILFSISFSIKYYVIKKYSPDVFLSLIVYLFGTLLIYDFNGMRQGVAMSLVLFSIQFILNRKIIFFLLTIIIASLFHISALIFIPFYFLYKIEISNKAVIIFLMTCILIAIPMRSFIENTDIVKLLLATESLSHYSTYADADFYAVNPPILSMALFQRLFVFLLFIYFYEDINVNHKLKLLLRNAYFISILIFLFMSFNGQFAARLSFYYKNVDIIIIPMIVCSLKNKYQRVFMLGLFVLFCMFGAYRLISMPNSYLLPYDNLLNHIL